MAKNKFESNEEVIVEDREEVALTEEQHLLIAALESDDVIGNLSVLKDDEGTTEKLATLITVYIALQNALGDDAGATVNARQNLVNYKPAKVKAAKKPKEPKAPKERFNERKALAEALETDSLSTSGLIDDERISEELKNAIITYITLRSLDLPEAIIDTAKITLAKFGRKGTTKTQNTEAYSVEVNGVVYSTRSKAVRAQGFGTELVMVGDKERKAEDLAWRSISSQFNKNDTAVYDNVTYTKVAKVEDIAA